jgi:hypothetical protein
MGFLKKKKTQVTPAIVICECGQHGRLILRNGPALEVSSQDGFLVQLFEAAQRGMLDRKQYNDLIKAAKKTSLPELVEQSPHHVVAAITWYHAIAPLMQLAGKKLKCVVEFYAPLYARQVELVEAGKTLEEALDIMAKEMKHLILEE